jgi:hypothetical protein
VLAARGGHTRTNFNMTGSVLSCDKLTFFLSFEVWIGTITYEERKDT